VDAIVQMDGFHLLVLCHFKWQQYSPLLPNGNGGTLRLRV
jgi:hypothetical protein